MMNLSIFNQSEDPDQSSLEYIPRAYTVAKHNALAVSDSTTLTS